MKVGMVYPHPDSEKGISKYSIELINNIKKQNINIKGITFTQGKFKTLLSNFKELKKCDIVHIQHEYGLLGLYGFPFFLFYFFSAFYKFKVVTTMHTVLSQKEKFKGSKLKTLLRKVLYFTQNRVINWCSDKVVVHAEFFRDILVNEYNFDHKKIIILPHPILENIKTVSQSQAKKELNISGKIYLLIGTIVPDHGHDIILRQADKIGSTIIVATNPSAINYKNVKKIKEYLSLNKKIVEDGKFEKFVRFDLGEISYDKWWKYFAAADLVLLPYRGGIGSGIFADAMALNKPVVASNVQYFAEFSKYYGCLKVAKNDEDFSRVIREAMKPENYKKMIQECQRYLKENGLTPISRKYAKLYSSL